MQTTMTSRNSRYSLLPVRRALSAICFLLTGGMTVAAQTATPNVPKTQEFTISANVELVLLDVSVRDREGGFVSGLKKDDFKVYENGKIQTITQFQGEDQPVTVGIIVDNSGSMRPKRPEVVTAALAFIGASNPLDEMFVINFNDKVRRGLPDPKIFSDDVQELRAALWRGPAEGRTALYDAIAAGLKHLEMGRQSKKTLLVVSDGGDNISENSFRDIMRQVLESHATIYTVGVYDDEDQDKNPDVLRKLANVSGGVAYFPRKLEQVAGICRQIAKDIRSRYTVAYVPPDAVRAGMRHIKVEATSETRGKLVARTRTGYMIATATEAADRSKK